MKARILFLALAATLIASCATSPTNLDPVTPPSLNVGSTFDVNVRTGSIDTTFYFTVKLVDISHLLKNKVTQYSTPGYPNYYITTEPNGDVSSAVEGDDSWFTIPVGSKAPLAQEPVRTELFGGNYKITETVVAPKGQETFSIKGKAYVGDVFEATNVGKYYNASGVVENTVTTMDKHVYSKDIGFWLEQQFDTGTPSVQTNTLINFKF